MAYDQEDQETRKEKKEKSIFPYLRSSSIILFLYRYVGDRCSTTIQIRRKWYLRAQIPIVVVVS